MLTQAAAGVTGDNNYGNTATNSGDGTQTVAFADVIGEGNYDSTATATNTGTISGGGRVMASAGSVRPSALGIRSRPWHRRAPAPCKDGTTYIQVLHRLGVARRRCRFTTRIGE